MYVCMYVSIYLSIYLVCMYVCMYLYIYVYVGIEVDIRAYNAALKACLVSGSDELVEKGIQLFADMMQNKVATAPPNLTSLDIPH